ncbi:hypothetical protein [Amycolatopsis minnesotensis]|uniref:Uncharacterized protein n=1 Tax=Amycolatopsis minnesotensis TaxID=337894 RepID=A0ABN2SA97_9PSEU
MSRPHGGHPRGRRFTISSFIAALPRPGEGEHPPSAWNDLVYALPWLFVVFIGWSAHWTSVEITGLIAILISAAARPDTPPRETASA